MKIVVLAGGISTERDVSFVSGKNVYEALKSKGHQVVLTDVYLGMEEMPDNVFEAEVDWTKQIGAVTEQCPDIEAVKAMRKDGGPCAGTCEKCDEEIMYLNKALAKIPESKRVYPTLGKYEPLGEKKKKSLFGRGKKV